MVCSDSFFIFFKTYRPQYKEGRPDRKYIVGPETLKNWLIFWNKKVANMAGSDSSLYFPRAGNPYFEICIDPLGLHAILILYSCMNYHPPFYYNEWDSISMTGTYSNTPKIKIKHDINLNQHALIMKWHMMDKQSCIWMYTLIVRVPPLCALS